MQNSRENVKHRLLTVLYVLANLLILFVPFQYYDSYKNYLEFEPKYNIKCIDSGALYTLHGDTQPMDLSLAEMKNSSNLSNYEDWFRFGCEYHYERQQFLESITNANSPAEYNAQLNAYRVFEESKPKIEADNFEYVEITNKKDLNFYYRFIIEPILVMLAIWIVLQVFRIVYQRNYLSLFTWHPYSLAKARPLSDKAILGFNTSYEWAKETYKSSVLAAANEVKVVSFTFLAMIGPFIWLYGYLLWNVGIEGMLMISLLATTLVLVPLLLLWAAYSIKKKFASTSHLRIAITAFLGLMLGILVSILWLVFSYIDREYVFTANVSATWGFLSIFGLVGFIYTIKLFRTQLKLVYVHYLTNKYTDRELKTIDSSDTSLTHFLFRLIYPRVDTTKISHRFILLVGWIATLVTWGLAFVPYFGLIQRVIYYVIYGEDSSKWKKIKELTIE